MHDLLTLVERAVSSGLSGIRVFGTEVVAADEPIGEVEVARVDVGVEIEWEEETLLCDTKLLCE